MMGKRKKTLMADDISNGTLSEAMIDVTLADSFPASDPPAWTLGRENQSRLSLIEGSSEIMETQLRLMELEDAERIEFRS
jgi:hypothetical protein